MGRELQNIREMQYLLKETVLSKSANQKPRKTTMKQTGKFNLNLKRNEQTLNGQIHTHKVSTVTLVRMCQALIIQITSGAYEGKEHIIYIEVVSKNKVELLDSHLCQCIVGTYTLTKIPYRITNNGSSKNGHNMLQLASLKTSI